MTQIRSIVILLLALIHFSASDFFPEKDDPLQVLRVRKPRFISFLSRSHPDAKPEYGLGFSGHLNNFLKGGTIGVEFKMPKGFDSHMEKLGKKFPFLTSKSEMKGSEKNEWEAVEKEGRSNDYGFGLLDPRMKQPK